MRKSLFGKFEGKDVYLYTLANDVASLKIMTKGATVVSFKPYGAEIVGGFDSFDGYLADTSNQGSVIGRVANRIENATFSMDGAIYMLPENDNGNCLHGGRGFNHRMWDVVSVTDNEITLSYYSPDGEEGFPAGLTVKVTYTLIEATLVIRYTAVPDGKTPVALTNHSYFNLNGFGDTVLNHTAVIYADRYTEVDEWLIPTGKRPSVAGTAFDFNTPHPIGERFSVGFDGYDHNYILSPKTFKTFCGKSVGLAAEIEGERLKLSVYTDQPGMQFYTSNFLEKSASEHTFHGGIDPIKHGGLCLEAGTEPNCINHGIGFYDAGEVYTQTTVYQVEEK